MDPLTTSIHAVVLGAAARYVVHLCSQLIEGYKLCRSDVSADRQRGAEKFVMVIANGVVPVLGTSATGWSAIDGGVIGSVLTGLALAAGVAGLHHIRNRSSK